MGNFHPPLTPSRRMSPMLGKGGGKGKRDCRQPAFRLPSACVPTTSSRYCLMLHEQGLSYWGGKGLPPDCRQTAFRLHAPSKVSVNLMVLQGIAGSSPAVPTWGNTCCITGAPGTESLSGHTSMRQLLSDIALIPDANRRGGTFERVVKWLLENVWTAPSLDRYIAMQRPQQSPRAMGQ